MNKLKHSDVLALVICNLSLFYFKKAIMMWIIVMLLKKVRLQDEDFQEIVTKTAEAKALKKGKNYSEALALFEALELLYARLGDEDRKIQKLQHRLRPIIV